MADLRGTDDEITSAPPVEDALLADPLGTEARHSRRNLLVASAIGLLLTEAGLVPTKIAALGVELDRPDQAVMLRVFAAIVAYFLAAFVIYGVADFVNWAIRANRAMAKEALETVHETVKGELRESGIMKSVSDVERYLDTEKPRLVAEALAHLKKSGPIPIYGAARPLSRARIVFDFVLPLAVALFTIGELLGSATGS